MTNTTIATTVPVPPPTGIEAKESSRMTGAVASVVNGIFTALTTYGITYDAHLPHHIDVLVIALATFFSVIVPLVQAEVTRGKVWSAASVARIAEAAVVAAPPVIAATEDVVKDVTPAEPDGAPAQPAAAAAAA